MGYIVLALLLVLAGALAGYRLAWMDAYEKGYQDAAPRADQQEPFSVAQWRLDLEATIKRRSADLRVSDGNAIVTELEREQRRLSDAWAEMAAWIERIQRTLGAEGTS